MKKQAQIVLKIMAVLIVCLAFNVAAKDVPAQLPDPDGKPPDVKKPLKVYILSGQSNMVGMGKIAGFCWWQGHKDKGMSQRYYERHLVNLIKDLRAEFNAPNAPFAVATVGFEGKAMGRKYQEILNAQMAVGDPKKHPEFVGNVASIDTRGFWRSGSQSPTGAGYHYNGNAETYTLVGDALGRAMVKMLKKELKNEKDN